jgi:hypothetical protein
MASTRFLLFVLLGGLVGALFGDGSSDYDREPDWSAWSGWSSEPATEWQILKRGLWAFGIAATICGLGFLVGR